MKLPTEPAADQPPAGLVLIDQLGAFRGRHSERPRVSVKGQMVAEALRRHPSIISRWCRDRGLVLGAGRWISLDRSRLNS